MKTVEVDGSSLTLADFDAIVSHSASASLAEEARRRIAKSRATVDDALTAGNAIYGVTTGFGNLATVRIEPENIETIQERLILSHCAGVGEALPDNVVRGMLLLRASTLRCRYLVAAKCVMTDNR